MRFLLVDRVLKAEKGRSLIALKCVALSEDYFADHVPVMPGSLVLEAFEQASHLLVGLTSDFTRAPMLRRVPRGSFRRLVRPGDRLLLRVTLTHLTETEAKVQATADSDDQKVADAQLEFDLRHAAQDPEAAECCRRLKAFYDLLTFDPASLTHSLPEGERAGMRGLIPLPRWARGRGEGAYDSL